jgi:hypothetical protein
MSENPLLPGFDQLLPSNDNDWFVKGIEVSELFSPTAPVRESDLFAGRPDQINKMIDAIFQAGQHAVVYGDRGVGKTSLVNTISQKVFSASKHSRFFTVQCLSGDTYVTIWERALKYHRWSNDEYAVDDIDSTLNPISLSDIISRFNANNRPIFIFDEYDRIGDDETKLSMAETVKLLSDRASFGTIVIVGVARTIRDLIYDHESIKRAIKQIEMPRMTRDEIRDLITLRLRRVAMQIEPEPLETIIWLSRGMPGYAQLLGLYSAKRAIAAKSIRVAATHLYSCLDTCLEEAGESTRQAYSRAIQSAKPNNLLRQALLACSVSPQDEFGAFTAAAIREPISRIIGKRWDIPDYARYLKIFCSDARGRILEKEGSPKNYQYRFTDPMMQSYVITKGIADGLLRPPTQR